MSCCRLTSVIVTIAIVAMQLEAFSLYSSRSVVPIRLSTTQLSYKFTTNTISNVTGIDPSINYEYERSIWLKDDTLLEVPESTQHPAVMVASLLGAVALVCGIKVSGLFSLSTMVQSFTADPIATTTSLFAGASNPSLSMIYFGLFYVVAELIAIPATPLTLSAGCLFGVTNGTLIVLAAGLISSIIGFILGRVFLRDKVEGVLDDKPTFSKLDKAIGSNGLKMLVLARLTPIFPFCLLNYFYGASSISFGTFILGTLIGIIPTTVVYTYTGLLGKEIAFGGGSSWYIYVGVASFLIGVLKTVTDVATNLINAVGEEDVQ